ncbi:helix-turn-helix transcriptional regulator [Jiella marina]|uniref:helix-turn-helix transcriptional regulator n=1 Tax=Jiella sp. LLJ827 TaxID=2917712 RepID=UPI002101AE2F|nr:metalloregulator ArsR/SmtB family transcription factor [Jiella sp. LLJ827]MCQ0986958.1 transcriptional regulator [Jiella sp. LLJ827]
MTLKMHGAMTAAALGDKLGTTAEAARQQLVRLGEDGLVAAESRPAGRGRPTQRWALTEAAQARFPDTHAALTVELLDSIRTALGEDALNRVIARRETETRRTYEAAMRDCSQLNERVAALAAMRTAEGYMAEWQEREDGSLLLTENHCPICAAASACQGFCRAELQVFKSVLGPSVAIDRAEHIVSGGRRCTYIIKEA